MDRCASRSLWPRRLVSAPVVAVLLSLAVGAPGADGQITYLRGQNIAPSFEGWLPNPDGTFEIFFGYMNRNFDERLHIPIGAENNIEPGGPDLGQPTYFFPRRNRDVFTVTVPADFGDQELVWTITANGKTERTYASLLPEFIFDQRIIYRQHTGFDVQGELEDNEPPTVRIEGETRRSAIVGRPLSLTAVARDDGIPAAATARGGPFQGSALGLRVAWYPYRGNGAAVSFEPRQFKVYPDFKSGSPWTRGWSPPPLPEDVRFPVRVTFGEPGTFVLRVLAHDGGATSTQEVTITVSR